VAEQFEPEFKDEDWRASASIEHDPEALRAKKN
jgi:hypothetical protein